MIYMEHFNWCEGKAWPLPVCIFVFWSLANYQPRKWGTLIQWRTWEYNLLYLQCVFTLCIHTWECGDTLPFTSVGLWENSMNVLPKALLFSWGQRPSPCFILSSQALNGRSRSQRVLQAGVEVFKGLLGQSQSSNTVVWTVLKQCLHRYIKL